MVTARDADADGICDDVDDCVGAYDECGIRNGPGAIYECGCADIPEGDCDCDGKRGRVRRMDADGICDDVGLCRSVRRVICNGPGHLLTLRLRWQTPGRTNDNGLCARRSDEKAPPSTTALARLWTVCVRPVWEASSLPTMRTEMGFVMLTRP